MQSESLSEESDDDLGDIENELVKRCVEALKRFDCEDIGDMVVAIYKEMAHDLFMYNLHRLVLLINL